MHWRPERHLPSDTEDPKKNQIEPLRNGWELEETILRPKKVSVGNATNPQVVEEPEKQIEPPWKEQVSTPKVLFPQRLRNVKHDVDFNDFLKILKQLTIYIHFVKAVRKMPNYG